MAEAAGTLRRLADSLTYAGRAQRPLGQYSLALQSFEKAIRTIDAESEQVAWMIFLTSDPAYDHLRGDARFEGLVEAIGFER
jgi:hypothetical protein